MLLESEAPFVNNNNKIIRHSLNLKTTSQINEKITSNTITAEKLYPQKTLLDSGFYSVNSVYDTIPAQNIAAPISKNTAEKKLKRQIPSVFKNESNATANGVNSMGSSKSNSISSMLFISSANEELIPIHPVPHSKPQLITMSSGSKKKAESTPLINLVKERSNNVNLNSYYAKKEGKRESDDSLGINKNNSITSFQQSPGFVINRMKERHRQEYRRSLQWAPTIFEQQKCDVPIQRASSLVISNGIKDNQKDVTTQNHQQQIYFQQQSFQKYHQQPIIKHDISLKSNKQQQHFVSVPSITSNINPSSIVVNSSKKMTPINSFSTSHFSNKNKYPSLTYNTGAELRSHIIMKPIQEDISSVTEVCRTSAIGERLKIEPNHQINISEGIKVALPQSICCSPSNCCKRDCYCMKRNTCYTNSTCHAKRVAQPQRGFENERLPTLNQQIKNSSSKKAMNDNRNFEVYQSSNISRLATKSKTVPLESVKFVNAVEDYMKINPKLKKDYQRMQKIHKKKCFSVLNLRLLLDDNKELNTTVVQKRKSVENKELPTAKPVALVSKRSDLKRKGSSTTNTIKNESISHTTCTHHHSHRSKEKHHNYCCHGISSGCKQHVSLSCCYYAKQVKPSCCSNEPRTQNNSESSRIAAPPKFSISSTSLGTSKQPNHTIENVRYDIFRKNHHYQQIQRPVCSTCRH